RRRVVPDRRSEERARRRRAGLRRPRAVAGGPGDPRKARSDPGRALMPAPALARPARGAGRGPFLRVAVAALVTLLLAFLALPFLALLLGGGPAEIVERLGSPLVVEALGLSLLTSAAATALVVVLGLPVAWLLATREFPGRAIVEVLVDLPMVLPPTVAGFALLLAFGRAGVAGHALHALGVSIPFTTAGGVVAQGFMSVPFMV